MKTDLDRWVSSEGRLSRQGYLLGFILPVLMMAGLTAAMIVGWLDFLPIGVFNLMVFGWLILLFVLGDAMNIRRYHDIGNSGRLYRLCRPGIVVLPLLAFAIDFLIPAQMASSGDVQAMMHMIDEMVAPTMHPIAIALLVLPAAAAVFNFAYLVAMPGQAGPNDFGPPPTAGRGAAPAHGVRHVDSDDDPVKRALADYHARQAQMARPATQMGPAPASFGKKRR